MKCEEVQRLIPYISHFSDEDETRIELEAHLLECDNCLSVFELESEHFLQEMPISSDVASMSDMEHINRNVMERIHYEESWLSSISAKSYHFTKNFRRNIAIAISSCMAMFVVAIFFFIFDYNDNSASSELQNISGLVDTVNASSGGVVTTSFSFGEIPVASISDPIVLKVVPSFPQYYVALSLLGLIMTLLILNWLSRTRN